MATAKNASSIGPLEGRVRVTSAPVPHPDKDWVKIGFVYIAAQSGAMEQCLRSAEPFWLAVPEGAQVQVGDELFIRLKSTTGVKCDVLSTSR